jgi:hypothetical protein
MANAQQGFINAGSTFSRLSESLYEKQQAKDKERKEQHLLMAGEIYNKAFSNGFDEDGMFNNEKFGNSVKELLSGAAVDDYYKAEIAGNIPIADTVQKMSVYNLSKKQFGLQEQQFGLQEKQFGLQEQKQASDLDAVKYTGIGQFMLAQAQNNAINKDGTLNISKIRQNVDNELSQYSPEEREKIERYMGYQKFLEDAMTFNSNEEYRDKSINVEWAKNAAANAANAASVKAEERIRYQNSIKSLINEMAMMDNSKNAYDNQMAQIAAAYNSGELDAQTKKVYKHILENMDAIRTASLAQKNRMMGTLYATITGDSEKWSPLASEVEEATNSTKNMMNSKKEGQEAWNNFVKNIVATGELWESERKTLNEMYTPLYESLLAYGPDMKLVVDTIIPFLVNEDGELDKGAVAFVNQIAKKEYWDDNPILRAIEKFLVATHEVPKLDADGNPVLDENGNPVTVKTSGLQKRRKAAVKKQKTEEKEARIKELQKEAMKGPMGAHIPWALMDPRDYSKIEWDHTLD